MRLSMSKLRPVSQPTCVLFGGVLRLVTSGKRGWTRLERHVKRRCKLVDKLRRRRHQLSRRHYKCFAATSSPPHVPWNSIHFLFSRNHLQRLSLNVPHSLYGAHPCSIPRAASLTHDNQSPVRAFGYLDSAICKSSSLRWGGSARAV